MSEAALTVEENTTRKSYTVVLDSEPSDDIRVKVGGYAGTDVTPTPANLTFTRANWNKAQSVAGRG